MGRYISVNYNELANIVGRIGDTSEHVTLVAHEDQDVRRMLSDYWTSDAKASFEELHSFLVDDVDVEFFKIENCMNIVAETIMARLEIDSAGSASAENARFLKS